MYTKIKSKKEIASMEASGQICAKILKLLKENIEPGISTKHLAVIAKKEIKSIGAKPAFLGYNGFPEVICISLNQEVVHGIPSEEKIVRSGDIVSLDLGINYDGMIVDSAVSVLIESKDLQKIKLLETTLESLKRGIEQVKDGCRVGDIGSVIEKMLKKHNLGIVRDLVGHGVGHSIHEEPNIPNYGSPSQGDTLKAGMTIAIEPMATLGGEAVVVAEDGWTVNTVDGSPAAHFEQTVLITQKGYKVLTPFL